MPTLGKFVLNAVPSILFKLKTTEEPIAPPLKSIKEFKPGKVLPSKNEKSSLLKFKQEFQKLIK